MRSKILVGLAAGVLALAGCGDDDDGSASGGDDVTSFCEAGARVESLGDDFGSAMGEIEGLDDVDAALDQLYAELDEMRPALDEALDTAPDEIRDDVELVVDAGSSLLDAFPDRDELADAFEAAIEGDSSAVDDLFADVEEAMGDDDPELEAASDRIDAYLDDNCPGAADDDDEGAGMSEVTTTTEG